MVFRTSVDIYLTRRRGGQRLISTHKRFRGGRWTVTGMFSLTRDDVPVPTEVGLLRFLGTTVSVCTPALGSGSDANLRGERSDTTVSGSRTLVRVLRQLDSEPDSFLRSPI